MIDTLLMLLVLGAITIALGVDIGAALVVTITDPGHVLDGGRLCAVFCDWEWLGAMSTIVFRVAGSILCGSPGAFALAVSAHAAGIRAILLIGTASARLKREPFAALYTSAQVQVSVNRQHELSPKRFLKGNWTNAKLWRGVQPVLFQK
jgi:hypothetical protein